MNFIFIPNFHFSFICCYYCHAGKGDSNVRRALHTVYRNTPSYLSCNTHSTAIVGKIISKSGSIFYQDCQTNIRHLIILHENSVLVGIFGAYNKSQVIFMIISAAAYKIYCVQRHLAKKCQFLNYNAAYCATKG